MPTVDGKLKKILCRADVIPFNTKSKFIIMSDCHRGQGNTGDNFLPNQLLFFAALKYYYENGFTYIELGDGDELWENRKMKPIIEAHSDAYWIMSQFYKDNRFYMLYGNHDIVKRRRLTTNRHYSYYFCEKDTCVLPLFPGIKIHEGLVLNNSETNNSILLVHGHQGSFLNNTVWPLARFLVRYVWKPLEMVGFQQPTGAGRSHSNKEKIEKDLASFAQKQQQIVIAGHTHRPVYPSPGEGLYFNDGSCVHPRCITGIEIENNQIALIKWAVGIKKDRSMYVERLVLEGPNDISAFYSLQAEQSGSKKAAISQHEKTKHAGQE